MAREAPTAGRPKTPDKPRFVAGAIGPLNRNLSMSLGRQRSGRPHGDLRRGLRRLSRTGAGAARGRGGPVPDRDHLRHPERKAAIKAILDLEDEGWSRCRSGSPAPSPTARAARCRARRSEAFWNSVRHAKPFAVGFNCALGAELMRPHIAETGAHRRHPGGGLSQRRPAQRLGPVRRGPAPDRPHAAGVGRERSGQHPRRLLRHHA